MEERINYGAFTFLKPRYDFCVRKYSTSASKIEKLLEKHGFLIYELLTPDDIQKDVIDKAGSDLKAFEHVNYCLAVRKG